MMHRYTQQVLLPQIGVKGQEKLLGTRVLVIGAGGLGNPLAVYLGSMGVGKIGVMDFDRVQASNLHRQFVYHEGDIGAYKSEVISSVLRKQNPGIEADALVMKLNGENAGDIISRYDFVCDCTDNVDTRLLTDKICGGLKKPLIYAAVRDWQGYVTVLHATGGIGLTDIFAAGDLQLNQDNNCGVSGIAPAVCGIVGSYQASEVMKLALGVGSILDGAILCIDALEHKTRIFKLQKKS